MKRKTVGCLLVAVGIPAALVAYVVASILYQFYRHTSTREHITFVVPGTGIEVAHSRIGIHPMMAEYDRDLTFMEEGKPIATVPLQLDTCGGYPINCYLIKTPELILLRLDDAVSEHLVDLTNHLVYAVTNANGKAYIAELDGSPSSMGWSMVDDDPSTLQVHIGDTIARPMEEIVGNASEKYIGRIDGKVGRLRFIGGGAMTESASLRFRDCMRWTRAHPFVT